jgi:hypothetical protein
VENEKFRSVELSRQAEGRTAQLNWRDMAKGRTDRNNENVLYN